jgi:3-phytase
VRRVLQFLAAIAALAVIVVVAQLGLSNCLGPGTGPGPSPTTAAPTKTKAPPLPNGAQPLIREGGPKPTIGKDGAPAITPSVETELFPEATGDVADDSAIWRNPDHPERSFVVADDKSENGGVAVYGLDGKLAHYERTGKIGNIDLRDGFRLGDRDVVPVGANDRTTDSLRFWTLDPADGRLTPAEAGRLPSLKSNYGFCLGRGGAGGKLYAFVSAENVGSFEQYELGTTTGKVTARKVRAFDIGSQTEGCVVDDVSGALYVGEEDVGVWRYAVDPTTGSARTSIDRTGPGGHLTADAEGLAATRGADGRGYLVVSSQGDSTFAVYDLDGEHAYRGSFQIRRGEGASVDGVDETDGVAVAAGDFGPRFPNGLLVAHDGQNHRDDGSEARCSNLKFVRLDQAVTLGSQS